MMRTVHGNPQRFRESYWEHIRPADGSYLYFAGDGARRDADGYFWVMGRVDDVINRVWPSVGNDGNRIGPCQPSGCG